MITIFIVCLRKEQISAAYTGCAKKGVPIMYNVRIPKQQTGGSVRTTFLYVCQSTFWGRSNLDLMGLQTADPHVWYRSPFPANQGQNKTVGNWEPHLMSSADLQLFGVDLTQLLLIKKPNKNWTSIAKLLDVLCQKECLKICPNEFQ